MPTGEKRASIKIAIVEKEGLFRELLATALSGEKGFDVCGVFSDAESALDAIPSLNPTVVLTGIELPGPMNGIELGVRLREQLPDLGIVILSHHRDPSFLEAVPAKRMSGWSYLLKRSVTSLESLKRAIEGTAEGYVVLDPSFTSLNDLDDDDPLSRLSPRHQEILALIAQGYSNGAIAKKLYLAEKSVENQVNLLYAELGISRRDRSIQPRVRAALLYLERYRGLRLDPPRPEKLSG